MRRITLYLVIAFGISWCGWWFQWGPIALLGPLLGAVVASPRGFLEQVKGMFKRRFDGRILLELTAIAFLLPLGALLVMQVVTGEPLKVGIDWKGLPALLVMILLVGGPIEEFGWRGFLQKPLTDRLGWVPGALLLGLVHGLWHLPLHFMEGTVQAQIPVAQFVAVTAVGALVYAYYYRKGNRNLWIPIVFHWLSNVGSALFPYWTHLTGRLIFMAMNMVLVIWLVKREKNEREVRV